MLTPEVSVNTATFQRGGLKKHMTSNMSRRYAKRIFYLLVFGGVTAALFFVFSFARVPAKEEWEGGVQNMKVQDDDYQDNIHLNNAGQDNVNNDQQGPENNLMAAEEKGIEEENNDDQDLLDDTTVEDNEEYHVNDDFIALESQKDNGDEHDNANINENGKEKGVNENEYNNNKYKDMQNIVNDFSQLKQNFKLPPEFLIKDSQGNVIGVKHLKNGIEDLINMRHLNKNTGDSNLNNLPVNKENVQQGLGQGAFNRAQQIGNPLLNNNNQIADNNIVPAGDRRQFQRGRFGDQPAQENLLDLNNFPPLNHQDNKQIDPKNGNRRNDGKPIALQTFNEYLKDRGPQQGQLVPPGPFEQRENNRIQDNFPANMNRVIQNNRFGLERNPQGNINADVLDNVANNLDILKNINPMLRANHKAPQDLNPNFADLNALQNINPLIPANNINLNNQDLANQNNPFMAGRENLGNPNIALNQLDVNQPWQKGGGENQGMLNNDVHVNNGFRGVDQQQQNGKEQEGLLPQHQQQEKPLIPEPVVNDSREPLQQKLFIRDLSAPVSIQAKCIDFRFPTGTGSLCIHSGDKDAEVSAKIEASSLYEVGIMNQILLILSNDVGLGFIDIGAGVGVFTTAVALMMRNVLAVEPLKVNCDLIHMNAVQNHVSNRIVLVAQALSNESYIGLTVFSDATGGYGGVQISRLPSDIDFRNLPVGANIVQVTTLDNLVQVAPFKRAVMKLDVGEEMEPNILGGGLKFLGAIDVPYIITHWSVKKKLHVQSDTMERLLKLGYVPKQTWNGPNMDMTSLTSDYSFLVWTKALD